jgi:hypothetical protein
MELQLTIRDTMVLAEALALASAFMERAGLPIDEPGNRADMEQMLEHELFQSFAERAREKAQEKLTMARDAED